MSDDRVVAAMLAPSFYPRDERPETVELVQTHISYVFLAGEYVYKVKKPVDFGFLDFRTLESRRFYCIEELELNRRLAPDFYLEVVAVCQGLDGALAPRGLDQATPRDPAVEYAVKMKRLPEDRMLKHLLARGEAGPEAMDAVAETLADFHSRAETGGEIDRVRGVASITLNNEENFRQTEPYIGRTVQADKHAFLSAYAADFVRRRRRLLERRVAEHRVRDCHGDVHLEHICLVDDRVVIFDCIEFNKRFRYSDVASEIAFLAMDLDYNGYADLADRFCEAYVRASGDTELDTLLNFYKCYRACVRAKVVGFRLEDQGIPPEDREAAAASAVRYFDLALHYAAAPEGPTLLATAGLMGTGKSVLARGLADAMGLTVIRTDVVRKELLHIDPAEHHFEDFGSGIYSTDVTARTYERSLELVREALSRGDSVVVDASFSRRAQRLAAQAVALESGAQFVLLECICPEEVVRERLDRRMVAEGEASDGRWELYAEQKSSFEPVEELPGEAHVKVDCIAPPEALIIDTLMRLRVGDGPGPS
jgi:hypothetical protein